MERAFVVAQYTKLQMIQQKTPKQRVIRRGIAIGGAAAKLTLTLFPYLVVLLKHNYRPLQLGFPMARDICVLVGKLVHGEAAICRAGQVTLHFLPPKREAGGWVYP